MKKNLLALSVGSLLVFCASNLFAATSTTMTVSLTILPKCTVTNPVPLTFTTTEANGDMTGVGSITATCTNTAGSGRVDLSKGANQGSTTPPTPTGNSYADGIRHLAGGGSRYGTPILYEIYKDTARTLVFGSGPIVGDGNNNGVLFPGDGAGHQISMYGKIAASDITAARGGTYADTVNITIAY